jgi:hypothetical protein
MKPGGRVQYNGTDHSQYTGYTGTVEGLSTDHSSRHQPRRTGPSVNGQRYWEVRFDNMAADASLPCEESCLRLLTTSTDLVADLNRLVQSVNVPTPDWRRWRAEIPGECPCGIARIMCTYHKE